MKLTLAILLALFFTGLYVNAKPQALKLSTDLKIDSPREAHLSSGKAPNKGVAKSLYQARKSAAKNNPKQCLSHLNAAKTQSVLLRPWIAVESLRCAAAAAKRSKNEAPVLEAKVNEVQARESWLQQGSHLKELREAFIEAYLVLLDRQVDLDRKKAWKIVDQINAWKDWMTVDQRADVYTMAGELAFVQQDYLVAQEFFRRSLNERDSSVLQKKLDSLQKYFSIPGDKASAPLAERVFDKNLEVTDQEKKIYRRLQQDLGTNDLVSAVENGVRLMNKFPGGSRAEWAKGKISSVFFSVGRKSDKKYALIKKRVMKQMKKVDGKNMSHWARRLYSRGYYKEAAELAVTAYDRLQGVKPATKTGLLAARAATSSGDYSLAEKFYREVADRHAGTAESREAVYRMGLMSFRTEKYAKASSFFERYLALPDSDKFELQAMYWRWRSQQLLKNEKEAAELAEMLWQRFPLTYYGLRARAESNNMKLTWPVPMKEQSHVEVQLYLTKVESEAWERYRILVNSGWFNEAQSELRQLPAPKTPQEQMVFSHLYSLAFDHFNASLLAHQSWDADRDLLNLKQLNVIYPREFSAAIEKESKANGIDQDILLSLIKQESSFQADAVSSARAMGLMQLMPGTAREMGRYKKKSGLKLPGDMFNPELNINFGSYYLKRMLRAHDGHLPVALAAYNVGIGNIRRWLRSRPELSQWKTYKTSNPINELWIDELPWSETSFYVKAILRNYLIYKLLGDSEVVLGDPVWTL